MARLRRMEIFVKLVETGQFTRAANLLSLSKSTVSQAISDLEAHLGLQLVKRNGRSVQITEAGELYYEDCLRILEGISASEDRVRGKSLGMSGRIRITAPDTYGTKTVTPLLIKFMELYPEISIDMVLTERQVDLITESVDLAFRIGEMKDSGLLARKIGSTKMVLCVSPDYLEKQGMPKTISDLNTHSCLVYSRAPTWSIYENGSLHHFQPKGRVKTTSGDNLRDMSASGLGIAYLPELLVEDAMADGRLVAIMKKASTAVLDIHLVRPAGRHCSRRVTALIEFIQSELQA